MLATAWPSAASVAWKTAKHFPPVLARTTGSGAALSSARPTGCALHGDSLFSVAGRSAPKKVSKTACPSIRVSLRETSRTPERGDSAAPAGPCSKSFVWLRRRVGNAKLTHRSCRASFDGRADCGGKCFAVFHPTSRQPTRSPIPFRRPSVGIAQGDARQDAERVTKGQGRPSVTCPRSNAGAREVLRSKTRMQGWPSFWLLFLGQTRKSDAPCKAQPVAHAKESAAYRHLTPRQLPKRAPTAQVPQC